MLHALLLLPLQAVWSVGVVRMVCLQPLNRPALAVQVEEVCDTIVTALSKYSGALHSGAKGAAAFGESTRGRMAVEALFSIANR